MKFIKTLSVILISIAAFSLFSGCTYTNRNSPYAGAYERANKRAHILGIVELEKDSYEPPSPLTFAVRTNDIASRRNISGQKVTFLWDLLTITDY